jgi:hypothetical protein
MRDSFSRRRMVLRSGLINLLSTRLRQDLGESAQHAIDLEGATARAVRAMKRMQPDGKKKR